MISTFIFFLLFVFCITLINLIIIQSSNKYILKTINKQHKYQAVLILGASVYRGRYMSHILYDRVKTAQIFYDNGIAAKFLISGDHGQIEYDEVTIVRKYLMKQGTIDEDIFMDHAGFDTYDSVYRAQYIFEINKMIIVTQKFHLHRAVYLARSLGIDAYGYSADLNEYVNIRRYRFREIFARVKAFFDILLKSKPKYLGEKIPITGDGRKSWY